MPDNLVLIGFSGTGKSAVARSLSARLGWPLVDTDQAIVERFGKSIATVFRDDGEAVFRAAEREIVAKACAGRRQVISLGGGASVDLRSRALIKQGNFVVRLDASPETMLRRMRSSPGAEERPMLAGEEPLARIRRLLAERGEAYAIADIVVDTEGRTVEQVATAVIEALEQRGNWRQGNRERRCE